MFSFSSTLLAQRLAQPLIIMSFLARRAISRCTFDSAATAVIQHIRAASLVLVSSTATWCPTWPTLAAPSQARMISRFSASLAQSSNILIGVSGCTFFAIFSLSPFFFENNSYTSLRYIRRQLFSLNICNIS